MFLANTLPFTSILPYVSDYSAELYYCMPLSLCLKSRSINIENTYIIHLNNKIISCKEKLMHSQLGNDVYIYDLDNKVLEIFLNTKISKAKILNTLFKCITINSPDRDTKLYGVYAVSFYDKNGLALSIASTEPIIINFANPLSINVYVPKSKMLLASTTKPCAKMFRDIHVYSNIVSVKGLLRNMQALVEILDPISLVSVVNFDNGCVEMELINPEDLDFNAIIKVYGYIDELIIDDLTKFKPTHSIIRIAMPMHAKSKLRLCMSTYMPKRSDTFLRLRDFVQVS